MTKSPSLEPAAVLIVEDDDMIRMIAAEFLEEAGFRVLEAGNADEAVRTLAAGEPIAAAGDSGGEDSPELYFEIRKAGKPIDPRPWFTTPDPHP